MNVQCAIYNSFYTHLLQGIHEKARVCKTSNTDKGVSNLHVVLYGSYSSIYFLSKNK